MKKTRNADGAIDPSVSVPIPHQPKFAKEAWLDGLGERMQLPARYRLVDAAHGFAIVLDRIGHRVAVIAANVVNPVFDVPKPRFAGQKTKLVTNVAVWTSSVTAAYKAAKTLSEGVFTTTPIVVLVDAGEQGWFAGMMQAESGRLIVTGPGGSKVSSHEHLGGGLSGRHVAYAQSGSFAAAEKLATKLNALKAKFEQGRRDYLKADLEARRGLRILKVGDVRRALSGEPDNG